VLKSLLLPLLLLKLLPQMPLLVSMSILVPVLAESLLLGLVKQRQSLRLQQPLRPQVVNLTQLVVRLPPRPLEVNLPQLVERLSLK
jgi:hypothetical protein